MGNKDRITAYVDGSFNTETGVYSFGCVFLPEDGSVRVMCGSGNDPENAKQRNVTGEMLGAMNAVLCAIKSGYKSIEIYYDYQGIEAWVTGAWKSKNDLTRSYSMAMRGWMSLIDIGFHKVEAHTGVKYNEIADKMAKRGSMTVGIPESRQIEEMEEWTQEK
ncbi:MAG: reverse transcriptase-like protein [Lachnospiraceae bacterium]|nr:reverse transcriptase-like protein [Lachnospiraceae bacterium]